ncbi:hypothetical protein SA2016_4144 (plasmid) [Sinomonas atrocyanea]|uniref:Uncharacterized protein n=1 Tax=Sinomonas atrocyanea TaxID=37927 RepID=A0A127A6V4_9MICC|nr:hypothetical protein [Sinomonas atrocyanea]AMM34796.1 hypothetical protein SA2016_4144 [Sinomonas atrocyanea]GEB64627.1 hypothetical protein SAT01_20750 [Sinomonas atrocyanea]GGG72175.1 hypothetical protein GCM10007172_25750 [Sinomonas atrocyanea]
MEEYDTERVAEIRSAGRAAGRNLGRKVTTHRTPPRDGVVVMYVGIADFTDEEHERMDRQSAELVNEALKHSGWPPTG